MMASASGDDTVASKYPMPEPLDPANPPPVDRFCDLVLKGGVVDGVVYPAAILELARHYRFNGLAGTSVGAIAAAIAAAAEYSRRFGSDDGFNEVLRKIPDDLAKTESGTMGATGTSGTTRLYRLFHPDKELERLFACFVEPFSVVGSKFMVRLWNEIDRQYRTSLRVGFLLGFLPGFFVVELLPLFPGKIEREVAFWLSLAAGLLGSLCLGLICALGALWIVLKQDTRALAQPGFGLCTGLSNGHNGDEAMTEWVHRGIQGAAKLPLGRPLTFKDLWDAPGGPKRADGTPAPKSIDLRMISTSVSHSRPYEFPVEDPSARLYFTLAEFREYFPESVMDYLEKTAPKYTEPEYYYSPLGIAVKQKSPVPQTAPDDLRVLPVGDLPVLVAARLSMNFPILFKAVPLWAIDWERGEVVMPLDPTVPRLAAPMFKKAWFTDGGLTSNFPIHFFDAAVPSHPTFGVFVAERSRALRDEVKGKPRKTSLAEFHTTGRAEKWFEIPEPNEPESASQLGIRPLKRYAAGMLWTAKDWADNVNLRMPGVRDRVVTLYKNLETNGGLNLRLPKEDILRLGHIAGRDAGKKLVHKFVLDAKRQNPEQIGTDGWRDHRWVRFNTYLMALKKHLQGFGRSVNAAKFATPFVDQIQQAKDCPPLRYGEFYEPTLTTAQANALKDALAAVQKLEATLAADSVIQPYQPQPQPELKVRSQI